jgi:7-cyano-7-deazaguanine synthase
VEEAINLGMDAQFAIHTPLMAATKAQTWGLAKDLGGEPLVGLIVEETVTCYEGDRAHRHAWGYGCGRCPACDLRAKGFAEYAAQ